MKKFLLVFVFVFGVVLSTFALQAEVRGGYYKALNTDDDEHGMAFGFSIRKSMDAEFISNLGFGNLKVGLGFDYIKVNTDDLEKSLEALGAAFGASTEVDVDFSIIPIYLEAMVEKEGLPFYTTAGIGIYKSKLDMTMTVAETSTSSSSSSTKLGGFIGAGVHFGIGQSPLSFRAGGKLHIFKANDDTYKALILDAGIMYKF